MRLPQLVLGWLLLFKAQLLEGREGGTRNGETAASPTWESASSGEGAAAGGAKDFEAREGGGTMGSQHQPPVKRRRPRQASRQTQPIDRPVSPAAAPMTAAAEAAAAAGAAASKRRDLGKGRILAAEIEVSEEGGATLDGSLLVPSFCPADPFERYVALHREIMAGELEPRFLVFRPYLYCGMGNRLKGLRGVMALAMMTDRALLVDWYGGLDGSRRRTSHKYEDNFLEAHGIPWGSFPPAMEDHEHYDGDKDSTQIWCQMPNAIGVTTPCDESRMTTDFLATAGWSEIYAEDTKVVIVQAHNHNPMEFVRLNEKLGVLEALRRLDGDVSPSVFDTCALRFLLKPRPEFKDRYCRERSDVLGGKVPSVSLHIRTGDNPDYHPEWYESLPQDVEHFVQCAVGFDEGLALVAAESSPTEPDFDDFGVNKEGADSVWLLGTDSSTAIDLLTESNNTVERGGKVAFIEGDEFHRAHSGSKGGSASNNAGPLIDLALLSEAPLLVGSHGSTFSENTAELGGVPGPLRLFLSTPFRNIVGRREEYDEFDDYRQGCRDLVSRPSSRDDVRFALRARLEPWIDCAEETRRIRY